ncbi:MAG: cation-translocating P-type ATPase [Rhodothermales bacterium]|nr:cation-translocating P-type ATPase [Rhodothermales bacterium]
MILRDDAFSTIVAAVERGRIIFENIRRFVVFLLSCNVSEVLVVGLASIAGAPLPILPLHLLYLNFVTDVFPALALGVGRGDPGVMNQPPRPPDEAVMERRQWIDVATWGSLITLATLGAFGMARGVLAMPETESVSIAFLTIGFAQLANVFNMRSETSGLLDNDIVRNGWVLGSVALCSGLLLVAVYVTPLADVLSITAPSATGWVIVAAASLMPLIVGQLVLVVRRGGRKTPREQL